MVDIEIDVVDAVGTLMEEPDVKTNETVGKSTCVQSPYTRDHRNCSLQSLA